MNNLYELYYQYVRSQEEKELFAFSFNVWRDYFGHNFE